MTSFAPFPDIETTVINLLAGLAPTGSVAPADLNTSLPFIRVMRIGGGDTRFIDTAHVDVDAFASTQEAAYTLAEACRQTLLAYPLVIEGVVIDSVETQAGPHEIPWGDPNVRHLTSSYTLTARR